MTKRCLISGYKKGELNAVNSPYHQSIAQALQGFIRMSFVWLMILALLPNIVAAKQTSKKAAKKAIILG